MKKLCNRTFFKTFDIPEGWGGSVVKAHNMCPKKLSQKIIEWFSESMKYPDPSGVSIAVMKSGRRLGSILLFSPGQSDCLNPNEKKGRSITYVVDSDVHFCGKSTGRWTDTHIFEMCDNIINERATWYEVPVLIRRNVGASRSEKVLAFSREQAALMLLGKLDGLNAYIDDFHRVII